MQPDYNETRPKGSELCISVISWLMQDAIISYVFYRSVLAFVLVIPGIVPWLRYKTAQYRSSRKEKLKLQFREMMLAVTAGLEAGYSVENAFIRAYPDMCLLYGSDSDMCEELKWISRDLKNNANLEELLSDLASRSHVAEIRDFADVFSIAKRSGGDLPAILRDTASLIGEKIEVRREITTLISAKKMEQTIMNIVPFGIIIYIDATSPGFFDPLYHNPFGVIMMSVMLTVYVLAYLLASKILKIEY
ncbi:MAG: type II secretion system F family protein [Lachnospiraceae bacterium]|nr:type II secretion system F family protein [Lachnospiraceae bacterium]